MTRRGTKLSPKQTILVYAIGSVLVAFIVAVAIPSFVRARLARASNACVNNLLQIDGAKQQWALEHQKPAGFVPISADITPYLGRGAVGKWPTCPRGGTYIVGAIGQYPTCSLFISNADWPNAHLLGGAATTSWWHEFKLAYANLLNGRAFSAPQ